MDRRICDFFEHHREEMLRDIAALVAIPSVKGEPEEGAPYGKEPRRALDEAARIARGWGLEARVLGDRVCVIELGSGEAKLGILAHLDVVPPAGDWKITGPYEMKLEDGVIYGRGVIDDKGPAVAALYALRAVRETGLPINSKVQLILGSDEENGSSDIAWYLENCKMPPQVFTPDGSFPVVNTEKGKLDMTVSIGPWERGSGAEIVSIEGGSVPNAVPAICRAVVAGVALADAERAAGSAGGDFQVREIDGGMEIICHGKASHASLPDDGVNAVTAMLQCLASMELDSTPQFEAVRALSAAMPFGDNGGRAIGAACSDAISGALTMNLGVISFSPEQGMRAFIDCRVPICGDGLTVAGCLERAIGPAADVTVTGRLEPHNVPAESDFVQGLLKIYSDYTGAKGEPIALGGLTYCHEVEGGVAFGCEFPGTETHMHEPDERVPVRELILSGEMFAQAIADFCG